MKKIQFFLMTALVAFAFAACSPITPPEEPKIFTVEVSDLTHCSATITVKCADAENAEAPFYWDLFTAEQLESLTAEGAEAAMNELLQDIYDYYSEAYGENVIMDMVALTGEDTYEYDGLTENTEYYVVSALLDPATSRVIPGKAEIVSFKTLEYAAPANVSFDLAVEDITAASAYIACTPNPEDARYILTWFEKAEWDAEADKAALFQELVDAYATTLYEKYNEGETVEEFLMDYLIYDYPVAGTIEVEPQTEYVLAAVAINVAEKKVYGEVASQAFTTPEAVMSDCQFTVTFSADGAQATITPSNNDPYVYWCELKSEFESYGQTYTEALKEWIDIYAMFGMDMRFQGAVTLNAAETGSFSGAGTYLIYGAGYNGYFTTEAFAYEWKITEAMLAGEEGELQDAPKKINLKRTTPNKKVLQATETKSIHRGLRF